MEYRPRKDASARGREVRQAVVPWLGGAALIGCAALDFAARDTALVTLLVLLPFVDTAAAWHPPPLSASVRRLAPVAGLLLVASGLLLWRPDKVGFAFTTLLFAALPEEWYFRAYLMPRIGTGIRANAATSLLFSLLHGLVWGWPVALQVFVPSLFYGWLYQRTRDFPTLVLVHALSNLVYVTLLSEYL